MLIPNAGAAAPSARRCALTLAVLALMIFAARAGAAITFGQLDDFQDGTTANWFEGPPSPNPPTNIATGGPGGAGDRYVRNVAQGEGGNPGNAQVMFNQVQWFGNYNAAHVSRVTGQFANFGTTPLHVRLALQGGAGSRFGSAAAHVLPADGVWRPLTFELLPDAMTRLSGGDDLFGALGSVSALRILSAVNPSFLGDTAGETETVLGVDGLRALHLPGDLNFDGTVNFTDFLAFELSFGTAAGAAWADGDFDFDGDVDRGDFLNLYDHFGVSVPVPPPPGLAPSGAAVPEPAVLAPLLLASGVVRGRRR